MTARVLVYGDMMLDTMLAGAIGRMSPEAPDAPVVAVEDIAWAAGGAANVAVNVAALGGEARLIGPVGAGPTGEIIEHLANKAGVTTALLPRPRVRATSRVRIVADGRQVMRMDFDEVTPLTAREEAAVLAELPGVVKQADVLVISDYAKGAVTPRLASRLIAMAASFGVMTVVDAKAPAAAHFRGATLVKPNLKEIARACRCAEPRTDEEAAAAAEALRRAARAGFVLLTRGEQGMCLAAERGVVHIAAHAVKAVDVTGAGDTVAAALALALARGDDIVAAARFANAAAAVAVTKRGTAAPTVEEVEFFYAGDQSGSGPHGADQGLAGERAHGRVH